jgi:indolepyruvate decarboxylase
VDVGDENYQAVTLREVLRGVIDAVPQVMNRSPRRAAAAVVGNHADGSAKLTQAAYWQAIQSYLRPSDVLYVDNGTSFVILGLKLPPKCTFVGSINWGSIGYSVGALLGALTAAPDRRHILFIGDGSFQVSAQELSTILRHDHKPVILLINNGGYTIERGYLGKAEPYNDVANWAYADLPKVFRRDTSARSFVVRTVSDLQNALGTPNDTMIFVESIMDPYDAPTAVIVSSNKGAELDYGPRGPQYPENAQLRPTTPHGGPGLLHSAALEESDDRRSAVAGLPQGRSGCGREDKAPTP